MSDLADSFEDVIDRWIEENLFNGSKYNNSGAMDLVRGAELDGISIPGEPQEQMNHVGLSVARVAHSKNFDFGKYPFDISGL